MYNWFSMTKLIVISLITLITSCAPIPHVRKDYWSFGSKDTNTYLENSTYFELGLGSKFSFVESMILYSNGYCALSYKKEFWKNMSRRKFLNKSNVYWGKYKLLNDSIVIQYFCDTGCGGGGLFDYTVHQLKGKFILNNSLVLEKFEYYQACGSEYIIKPIDVMVFSSKNIPFPSDSSNWLQKKNFK